MKNNIPLIAHIVFSFDTGGLENGVLNLINNMSEQKYRHVIICLSHYTDFANNIKKDDVRLYALHKKEGKDFLVFYRLWRLLLKIKPDIVHTRNLGTLECQLFAFFATIGARIHGEHGWGMNDFSGENKKYQLLRRFFVPLIKQYIALSQESVDYLIHRIHVKKDNISHIYNGVDLTRFNLNGAVDLSLLPEKFIPQNAIVFGTVGRMAEVKNQLFLINTFVHLLQQQPLLKEKVRLIIVGDGVLLADAKKIIHDNNLDDACFFAGNSHQVSDFMRLIDVFVLPSLAEGISNTILEAMASSLPVIATAVGGNEELVVQNTTGYIIPVNDIKVLQQKMCLYIDNPEKLKIHGAAGRERVEHLFSLNKMVEQYESVYQNVLLNK